MAPEDTDPHSPCIQQFLRFEDGVNSETNTPDSTSGHSDPEANLINGQPSTSIDLLQSIALKWLPHSSASFTSFPLIDFDVVQEVVILTVFCAAIKMLLGARTLLGTKGIATRSKDAIVFIMFKATK